MAERSPRRPELESRRPNRTVADTATQTEEEQMPEQRNTSLTRTQGVGGPLVQRVPAEAQVLRRSDQALAPAHHGHDHGGAPSVRVDMDLDLDINLQAKIKGEIELTIL